MVHRPPEKETFLSLCFSYENITVCYKEFVLLIRNQFWVFRFVFAVRPVEVPQISLHVSHPPPSWLNKQAKLQESLEEVTTPIFKEVWNVERQMRVQFPETRLIQYDSGTKVY